MILETDRLILDTWQPSDWTLLRPIATDPEVMRHITGGLPWTDEQIQNFADRQIQLYAEQGFCRWKLLTKSDAKMIGFCGLGFVHGADDPEIGWWLQPGYWGKGLATEAARLALRDAFERVQLDRIISIARPANTASIRIMQKLGLTFECEIEVGGNRVSRFAMFRSQYVSAQ